MKEHENMISCHIVALLKLFIFKYELFLCMAETGRETLSF